MNQVSRPMQVLLVACLVFAAAWFTVLKPKPAAEPPTVVPTPAAVASSATKVPRDAVGGASAQTALGKTIENAKTNAANDSSTITKGSDTANAVPSDSTDSTGTASSSASTSSSASSSSAATTTSTGTGTGAATSTPAATATTATKSSAATAAATKNADKVSAAQARANKVILKVQKDLAAQDAVVVLVYDKHGAEDKILHQRIEHDIDRRHGRVKSVLIPVGDIGRYDGLLSGLSLGQTPSTIVIAPNDQAKVLGGLVSVARIDRLTSSAILTKPTVSKTK